MKTTAKNNKLSALLIIAVILSSLNLICADVPLVDYAELGNDTDMVPLTSRAITGTLPNGLKYYILENSFPENRAHLALVVNAGSVLENEEQRGYAHFVEHLAFNDTVRFPKLELIDYLRSLGMRFGSDMNAYTSYDETVYYFDVPVEISDGIKKVPEKALAILDDWTYAVSFKHEDVESEKLVILEETRTRLGAIDRVQKVMLSVLFEGSVYAGREPIGLQSVIENATSEKLKDFYNSWYRSDNMALVFVGDFNGKALEAELQNHFNMPAAASPVNRPRYELPPPEKGNFRVEIITDPELTSSEYAIYYKQEAGAQKGTIAYYRQSVIDYLIYTMLAFRFEEAKSDPDAAASDYWGEIWNWGQNSRFYSIGTQPKTGNAEEALRELLLEKESMRRFGFTESELNMAKRELLAYMERQLSEKDKRESRSYINGFSSHFLTGEDMADIEWEVNAVNLLLTGIGLREISSAAEDYFAADDCIVFLIAPNVEADSLPSASRIKEIFREAEEAIVTQRQDKAVSDELMDRVPSPGRITSQSTDAETGAHEFVLANGAKVIVKETSNRNNEVILYAMAKGGTANWNYNEAVSVNLVSEMVSVSGLGPYSRTELINMLAGKQVSFSFWNSQYYRGFQGSSTTKDLKTLFEMLYIFFTMPKFDERAVAAMLDQLRTNLIHQGEDPQTVFSRELSRIIYGGHPLYMPLELDDIDKISLQQAFGYLNQCVNPGDYTFVFTGNINLEEILEYTANYIASVPNAAPMNQWNDPQIPRPDKTEKDIYKGIDDKCTVYLGWFSTGPSLFDEKKNQTAAVLSEYLDIMLTNEIRERLGGVYSISAGTSVSVIPNGEYRLSVYFQCAPARAEELTAAVQSRIMEIFNEPLNTDIFNNSKEALLMQHETSTQRNLYIAQSYANSAALYDTPLSRLDKRPDVIRSVTPEDVQALCRQIFVSGPVKVVLYPESWE